MDFQAYFLHLSNQFVNIIEHMYVLDDPVLFPREHLRHNVWNVSSPYIFGSGERLSDHENIVLMAYQQQIDNNDPRFFSQELLQKSDSGFKLADDAYPIAVYSPYNQDYVNLYHVSHVLQEREDHSWPPIPYCHPKNNDDCVIPDGFSSKAVLDYINKARKRCFTERGIKGSTNNARIINILTSMMISSEMNFFDYRGDFIFEKVGKYGSKELVELRSNEMILFNMVRAARYIVELTKDEIRPIIQEFKNSESFLSH